MPSTQAVAVASSAFIRASQQANELLFFETISHHISPYKPAAASSCFKVESRLCRLRNQAM